MLEILIDNKNGKVWDVSQIVSGLSWKTSRLGKPGSLDFTLIKNGIYQTKEFSFSNGDVVRFRFNDRNVFYGYIFSVDSGKDEAVRVQAFDQIRYLLNKDTYVFKEVTATQVLKQIADDFNLRTGRLDDTGYVIPTKVEDSQTLLDIIDKAIVLTLWNSQQHFVLFDDFGYLSLRNVKDLLVDFYIGDGSLMYDYRSKVSIDSDTFNMIKLVKDNKETGKREVYQAQDSANIAKWGVLQLYQSVDENKNEAQINQLLRQLMSLKNKETKSLRIDAIGDVRVRAGCYVPIVIEEFGVNQPFLVNECTHFFDGADHTMSLELKVI